MTPAAMSPRDTPSRSSPLARRLRRLTAGERRDEAEAFLRLFHRETGRSDAALRRRLAEVEGALRRRGTYDHTPDELAFGARIAWRNHARCIGRLFWESLEVIDCRDVSDPDAMAGHIVEHMATALGDGRIRSLMTVFAPARPDRLPPYVESAQITQYAGHLRRDGSVLGDRRTLEATRTARRLGWTPPDPLGAFDMLPFVIRDTFGRRIPYQPPPDCYREVAIGHRDHPALGALGLRWYAVPCISDMILTIGGIDYPCAPFNGFYMGTEIASRDLADAMRYDALPAVARAVGLDPDRPGDGLWRDRALTELNDAVLQSFRAAGVTIVDHHAASEQYMAFLQREQTAGRCPSGDWTWIVPPQASSACPVFHLAMEDRRLTPNFYRSRAADGAGFGPDVDDLGRVRRTLRRWRRRWTATAAL